MQNRVLRLISLVLDIGVLRLDLNLSFAQLGGDSLSAITLQATCKDHGIQLSAESILASSNIMHLLNCATSLSISQTNYPYIPPLKPSGLTPMALVESESLPLMESPAKASISQSSIAQEFSPVVVNSVSRSEQCPITEMQLSLLHGSQKQPGTNVIRYFETHLSRNMPKLKFAWKTVIDSEPIFRTRFDLNAGRAFLYEDGLPAFDWREVVVDGEEAYKIAIEEPCLQGIVGTAFRVVTMTGTTNNSSRSTLIWHVHHALIDGYSGNLLLQKVRRAAVGLPIHPGRSFLQLAARLSAFKSSLKATGLEFWKSQRQKYPTATSELLLPPPRTAYSDELFKTETITIQTPVSDFLLYVQQQGITLATLYSAAWAMVLSLYTDSDTVTFGEVLSGRSLPLDFVEDTIGPTINTLPFYVALDRDSTTLSYLSHVFSRLLELTSFQWTSPEDGFERRFGSAIAVQFSTPGFDDSLFKPLCKPEYKFVTEVPLNVIVEPDGTVQLNYHSNVYRRGDIESIGRIFENALLALLEPSYTIRDCLTRLIPIHMQHLRLLGNCSSKSTMLSSAKEDLLTLFECTAMKYPTLTAIEKGGTRLSYAELNLAAATVANELSNIVQPNDIVCVHADRSINWIIAIYAVLKARCAYCPFDEALPTELRNSNFELTGSKVFLVPTSTDKTKQPASCSTCLAVDEVLSYSASLHHVESSIQRISPDPKAVAYLCFTSGSSGKPKGVVCNHESLVAFQKDFEVRLLAAPGRRISQIMSPAFDGSIHEIFSALSYGATLVLKRSADPFDHLKSVDSAILTPSMAKVLNPVDYPLLKAIYLVGETVPQSVNDMWASNTALYNMYGPTEATCGATIKRLSRNDLVSIGVPNPSTRLYILDRYRSLVPYGVIGEIYLAGIQVSRGYIGRPEETTRCFLPDTICPELEERMYKTGDRGYWDEKGEIVCLGRNDRQIKLRGFRLDLNDLEIRALKALARATAITLVRKNDHLIGMVSPSSLDISDCRTQIAKVLPHYALPKHLIAVDSFPMTTAGKLDEKAIASITFPDTHPNAELVTATEIRLARVWRETLNLPSSISIDGDSNFMELGGDSLLQLHLSSELGTVFDRQFPLRLIVETPTLSGLAKAIDALRSPMGGRIQRPILGYHKVSPIELDWWCKYKACKNSSAFNVSFACNISRSVRRTTLATAWNKVLSRHTILRCKFVECSEGVQRLYNGKPARSKQVPSFNLRKEINRPFQLEKGNLIRVVISPHQFVVVISHIICDLRTLQILLREVFSLYKGATLPQIRKGYSETTLWGKQASPSDLSFWKDYLSNSPKVQYNFPNIQNSLTYSGRSHVCKIPTDTYQRLMAYTNTYKFTLHQFALAATTLAFQHTQESYDLILGAPYLNRESDNDFETVGLFLEPLPIRIHFSRTPSEDLSYNRIDSLSFVDSVCRSSQAALAHTIPWSQLLSHLEIVQDFSHTPLFDVMVTFHDDRHEATNKLPLQGIRTLYTWTHGAKFKIMLEFTAIDDERLLLRIEYDSNCFRTQDAATLESLVIEAMNGLAGELELASIRDEMTNARAKVERMAAPEIKTRGSFFGNELGQI
ncbi:hypothetical protein MMC11_004274 [Xylographa trunciseda]|nr:hypothetical protein [Xylographa trunciseda]